MENDPNVVNTAQADYWNGKVGEKWARLQAPLDLLLSEVSDALVEVAAPEPGERVLDVGCGTGATTIALADRVAPGRVTGADISEVMLNVAETRAAGRKNVTFAHMDVQSHAFAPGALDLVTSRFGVMFFDDPVMAFGNLRAALRPGGRIAFVTWAAPGDNPWMSLPRRVATARLGPLQVADDPLAPGPFAFSDRDRVLRILTDAGFADARVTTRDLRLHVTGTPDDAATLAMEIGPVPRLVAEKNGTEADLDAILFGIRDALSPYAGPGGVAIPGRFHAFTARRG